MENSDFKSRVDGTRQPWQAIHLRRKPDRINPARRGDERHRACHSLTEEGMRKVSDVKFLMADPDILGTVCRHPSSRLVWAQSTLNGVDEVFREIKKAEKTPDFILTRSAEGFGKDIAEFVLGRILSRERRFGEIHDLQKACQPEWWRRDLWKYRNLDQLDVAVLGFGEIGQEVAKLCKAVGMRIWAILRDERYAKEAGTVHEHSNFVRPMSRLNEVLESCDYLVSAMPSTPHTVNLLSGDVLKPCQRKKTCLINVGRGDVISEHSIINALQRGWLGGAILDVFPEEPLPVSSPLWTTPGVIVSPHVSAGALFLDHKQADTFIHNLRCYLEGRPMKNVVDFSKGY